MEEAPTWVGLGLRLGLRLGFANPYPYPHPHPNPNPNQVKGEGALTQDDKQMLEGALTFAEKQAQTRPVGARC